MVDTSLETLAKQLDDLKLTDLHVNLRGELLLLAPVDGIFALYGEPKNKDAYEQALEDSVMYVATGDISIMKKDDDLAKYNVVVGSILTSASRLSIQVKGWRVQHGGVEGYGTLYGLPMHLTFYQESDVTQYDTFEAISRRVKHKFPEQPISQAPR